MSAIDGNGKRMMCDCCNRRDFVTAMGAALGALSWPALEAEAAEVAYQPPSKTGAAVRVAFIYPPSTLFADKPDGWWSWPGNEYDAEGRQKQYTATLRETEKQLGMKLQFEERPIANATDAQRLAGRLRVEKPDGLLLVMFYCGSMVHAEVVLGEAARCGIPAILFMGLGVRHTLPPPFRPGLFTIQAMDDLETIGYGLRMINAKKLMGQSLILSITDTRQAKEDHVDSFLGTRIRTIPFQRYAATFAKTPVDRAAGELIGRLTGNAKELRGVTQESLENALRAHFALKALLAEEKADGVAMNCLRRGMLKPCISFSLLNSALIPAACQDDWPSALTLLLGRYLVGRGGFVHNLCYDTVRNTYYASHCTCPTRLHGPEGAETSYLLRRFAHTNEGSCAVQVFWPEGEPVTIAEYYPAKPGKQPGGPGVAAGLDVYAGKVVRSIPMPPAAGCTTNVEVAVTDRENACQVNGGHYHNVLFCGDFARQFRRFVHLYKMRLLETGYRERFPT